jgi:hypothetical protein
MSYDRAGILGIWVAFSRAFRMKDTYGIDCTRV